MVYYNVCSKKTYKKKDGTEKTYWPNCGRLKKTDDGKMFLELNMFPETSFFIFEIKPKEESGEFGG